jgi:LuxR family maltose regulon positive regulatory protein
VTSGDTLLGLGDPAGGALVREARSIVDRLPDPGVVGRHVAVAEARHRSAAPGRGRPAVRPAGLVDPLTERELAVLRYLPASLSQRDIAAELYVSLNTVKSHCRAIFRKLGVTDRRAAVQAGRDLHLL